MLDFIFVYNLYIHDISEDDEDVEGDDYEDPCIPSLYNCLEIQLFNFEDNFLKDSEKKYLGPPYIRGHDK